MSDAIRVILVDDDEHTRNLFEMTMQHTGFDYMVFTDGESAIAEIESGQADIAIIDLFLPGMDGYQLFSKMRPKVGRCIATTAYYTEETEHDVIERGFDAYIPKPFQPQTLAKFLSDVHEM